MKSIPVKSLDELVDGGVIQLTRGKIISKKDIAACPGNYPIYSSAKDNDGKFGEYGNFLFDEELITWSVDGGGRLFHRPKHKFSVTNVGGVLRILDRSVFDYRYLYYALTLRHSEITFDWVKKAHPSVIKKLYTDIPVPPMPEQERIVGLLDEALMGIVTTQANAEKNLQNAHALFASNLQSVFTQRGKGWMEKIIADCFKVRSGDFLPAKAMVESGCFNVYGGNGINGRHDQKNLSGENIIIGRVGAKCGNVHHVKGDAWVTDNALYISEYLCPFDLGFLTRLLRFKDLRSRANQMAQPVISYTTIKDVSLEFPASEVEQVKISSSFDALEVETQRLASIYERKLAALDALKKSLLHQAFTGEL